MTLTRRDFIFGGAGALAGAAVGTYATEQYYRSIIRKLLAPAPLSDIGKQALDFSLTGLDGKVHRLSQYDGKPTILNFWETWCGYCKEEIPKFHEFAQSYGDKVRILAVTTDRDRNTADYIKQNGFNSFAVLLDKDGKVFNDYIVLSIPTTFIIDSQGEIVDYASGTVDFTDRDEPLRKTIDSLLPEKEQKPNTNPGNNDLSERLA